MEMVTGAMGTLLPKLGDLLTEEYQLQKNTRGEIMFLKAELERMEAFLLQVSEAPIDQPPDIQVKLWARDVRELSYDLEDNIDKFMVRVDARAPKKPHSFRGFIDRSLDLMKNVGVRRKIGMDIKDIKTRVEEVRKLRDRYKVDNVAAKPGGRTVDSLRLSALYKEVTKLVGTKEKCDDLVKKLTEGDSTSNQQLKIVSIVGFGGLGKTTLANVVYQKLIGQFDCGAFVSHYYKKSHPNRLIPAGSDRAGSDELIPAGSEQKLPVRSIPAGSELIAAASPLPVQKPAGMGGYQPVVIAVSVLVSVSLNPNMEKIFEEMLHQLDKKKYSNINGANWGEAQLIDELREFLQDKRYFIVIDDIWNNDVWKTIKYALVENEQGSRILTTTRILDVAEQAGGVYQLKSLSHDYSRKLFYLGIFGSEDKYPPSQLSEVSENILKKCGGVPLAIITIASMLASKKGKEHKYWSEVYQSMGSGVGDSPNLKDMRRILSISYYDLPPHLKTCLLYLSLYPEDYEIKREDLIWRWVGEGFVHKEQGKSLSEVGEDYFVELINKSLIQPGFNYDEKTVCSCRVHDMVLDLITSLSNEEYFLTTVGGQQPMPRNGKVRRLSLQTRNEDAIKQMSDVSSSHVRSLVVFETAFSLLTDLSRFPVLRVLDLSDCDQVENHHFKHICSLFHLRYLNLGHTSITEIPREIENLQFLQVLYIRDTAVKELPSTFVQLGKLVCLKVDQHVRLPKGFGNLKFLQVLSRTIYIESATILHDLGRLTELRQLNILFQKWDENYREPFLHWLANLISLESLTLDSFCGSLDFVCNSLSPGHERLRSIEVFFCRIPAVPGWWASLSSLSSIMITLVSLGEGDLRVLGSIPSLDRLLIEVEEPTMDRDGRLVIGSGYPFLCLTLFRIFAQTMEVVFAQGAMQKLRKLDLGFQVRKTMDRFGDVDLGLENLTSLERVEVTLRGCFEVTPGQEEAAEAAVRKAVDMNPNNPTLDLNKR